MEREQLIKLVTSAQSGKSEAMNELFSEFYNDVYYFALKTVKDSEIACDITQETFIEIINTIDKLKEPVAFVTWMKQITYHQCTRYFKKKKDVLVDEDEDGNTLFDSLVDESEDSVPAEVYEKEEFRKTILGMIDELSEEQRSAVMMYYFDEMPVGEISKVQEVSEGTVKSRLNYARKAIKKSVESYEAKYGIKLHGITFMPLFRFFFEEESTMPAEKFADIQAAVTEAIGAFGIGTAVAAEAAATGASVSAEAATAASAGAGIGAKIAAAPIAAKIAAGIVAAAITVGGGIGVFSLINRHVGEDLDGNCICDCNPECEVEIHHFDEDDHIHCFQCGGKFFNYDENGDLLCDICGIHRCDLSHGNGHESRDGDLICDICKTYGCNENGLGCTDTDLNCICEVCGWGLHYLSPETHGRCSVCGIILDHIPVKIDKNRDGKCDKCEEYPCGFSHGYCHIDVDSNGNCDYCKEKMSAELLDPNGDGYCDLCGMCLCAQGFSEHKDNDSDGICDDCLLYEFEY